MWNHTIDQQLGNPAVKFGLRNKRKPSVRLSIGSLKRFELIRLMFLNFMLRETVSVFAKRRKEFVLPNTWSISG